MYVCGWNEFEVCTTSAYPAAYIYVYVYIYISSFRAMPVLYTQVYTHTRILKPFEDSKLMGLKVYITKERKGGAFLMMGHYKVTKLQ